MRIGVVDRDRFEYKVYRLYTFEFDEDFIVLAAKYEIRLDK